MQKYFQLGKKLFPITRSITGNGLRETLFIIKNYIKTLKIKSIRSGTKVFDWKIPPEWNITDAYIIDKNDKKIVDFKKSNLHVINYSEPVNLTLSKSKLLKRIYFLKHFPSAIPYITSYYKKWWGFCVSYNFFKRKLIKYKNNDKFRIKIISNFKNNGYLNYGEALIKGKLKKEILISTYICHPSMANNELSGPLVSTAIYNYFKNKKNKYSIRFVFIPETIGSISYINKNLKKLKKNIVAGFNLTCIGDDRSYSFLPSKYDSISNYAAKKAFKDLKIKFKEYSFLSRGSDERQYNSPDIELPIASIMRSKYGEYKEYHTSKDNFNLVTSKGLQGGFNVTKRAIEILMGLNLKNQIHRKKTKSFPKNKIMCEPMMSKRKLYPTLGTINRSKKIKDIMNFLQYADGTNSLKNISQIIETTVQETNQIYKLLKNHNLVS
jgi:aminopeptidase-like protein